MQAWALYRVLYLMMFHGEWWWGQNFFNINCYKNKNFSTEMTFNLYTFFYFISDKEPIVYSQIDATR